jgi:DNA repair exonuclease SbcCD nuclease subunit
VLLFLVTHKPLQNNGAKGMKRKLKEMQAGGDLKERENGVITIVLTADNHLGRAILSQHPRKRDLFKQQLRRAFQQATDFAVSHSVDLFVQAGDLFDSPNPVEQERSFVAECLAQLRQAGIQTFAVSGIQDTPAETTCSMDTGETGYASFVPAPQLSYAHLGALHYFAPSTSALKLQNSDQLPDIRPLEPVMVGVRDITVGICGLSALSGQEGDPLENLRVQNDLEPAAISLLVLHAPIEDFATGTPLPGIRCQVSRASIAGQSAFRYILAGYHHAYRHLSVGQCDLIVAGATQSTDFSDPEDDPGFVFLGLGADGIRWCKHMSVKTLRLRRLIVHTTDLWQRDTNAIHPDATTSILERLRPVCADNAMVQLRLEGELTRNQFHQLDLNRIRHYGEEHCFNLEIDNSALTFLSEQEILYSADGQTSTRRKDERLSPREELIALADEWIAAAADEQEQNALQATKEELLAALRST